MTQLRWRATTRLSVSGPAGWSPVERLEVHHEDGGALVRVESWVVAADADLDQLAAAHAAHVLPEDAEVDGTSPAEVLGSPGQRRTATWTEDGDLRAATLLHTLRGRRLVAITQAVSGTDATRREEVDAMVASLSVSDPLDLPEERLPLRPGEGVDLSEVGRAWADGAGSTAAETHVITTEESFAAARHYGVAMLPGADIGVWEAWDPHDRDVVASTAWKSLEARFASGEAGLVEALELAASHDLIVIVTTGDGDGRSVAWFAARPDRMARMRPTDHGRVEVTVHDTAELADLVVADRSEPAGTASAVRRHHGTVVGQEAAWAAGATDAEVRAALTSLLAVPDRDEVPA